MFKLFPQVDKVFFSYVLGISICGIIILTSASSPIGYARFGDSYYFLKHQLAAGVAPGLLLMFIFAWIPYRSYKKYAFPALIVSLVLLSLVFIPGIGTDFGTFANSWVDIGFLSFQPSEIVKLTFLFYLAAWMVKGKDHLKDFNAGLVPFLSVLGVIALLMIMQPDFGTLAIIAAMAFVIYFVAGGPLTFLAGIGVVGSVMTWILIQISPYRADRLMTFLHPELDPQGIGYQVNQALLAIGSGGFFGRGYGHSLQKFQYLPEVLGDSIFAVMGEELGFLMTVGLLIIFVFFLLRGLKIAELARDDFGKYLVIGIITWFGVQASMNVGAMIGILPLTGVPLPFISYGGTAIAVSLAACGVVLSVSRDTNI